MSSTSTGLAITRVRGAGTCFGSALSRGGFNPIQEFANYDVRIHHTNMDTIERTKPEDIQQAAVVFATFAYNAAMRDAMIPRVTPPIF